MKKKIVLQENKGNYLSDTPKKRFNIWRWLTGPSLNEIISNAIEDKRIINLLHYRQNILIQTKGMNGIYLFIIYSLY